MTINIKFKFWGHKSHYLTVAILSSLIFIGVNYMIFSDYLVHEFFLSFIISVIASDIINLSFTAFLSRKIKSLNLIHCFADSVFPLGFGFTYLSVFLYPISVIIALIVFLVSATIIALRYNVIKDKISLRHYSYKTIDIKTAFCLATLVTIIIPLTQV